MPNPQDYDSIIDALPDDGSTNGDQQPQGDPATPDTPQPDATNDPYHGKSREDVIAENKALQERLNPDLDDLDDLSDDDLPDLGFTKEQMETMEPADLIKALYRNIAKAAIPRIQARIQQDQQQKETLQETIGKQVTAMVDKYPAAKTNEAFRTYVKLFLQQDKPDGTRYTLEEAFDKVAKDLNIQPAQQPGTAGQGRNQIESDGAGANPPPRTDLETIGGAPGTTKRGGIKEALSQAAQTKSNSIFR